jgi:hypothetical protein
MILKAFRVSSNSTAKPEPLRQRANFQPNPWQLQAKAFEPGRQNLGSTGNRPLVPDPPVASTTKTLELSSGTSIRP